MTTASTTEKMTLFAPIPSASVATATSEKTGDLRNNRSPYRTSARMASIPRLDGRGPVGVYGLWLRADGYGRITIDHSPKPSAISHLEEDRPDGRVVEIPAA